jgi:hypothetical protein
VKICTSLPENHFPPVAILAFVKKTTLTFAFWQGFRSFMCKNT